MRVHYYLFLYFFSIALIAKAQCPVTSPTANLNTSDSNAPGCDAGTYRFVGQAGPNAGGTCFSFTGSSCGIAYYGSTYSLNCGFCVSFTFNLSTFTSDGIAFTMADFSQTPSGDPCSSPLDACANGGNIGYNTFNNLASNLNGGGALTIEYDCFDNTAQGDADLSCDHIAIVEDGNNNAFVSRACSPVNLDNGANHTSQICWDPSINRLTVSVDGSTVLTLNQNIRNYFSGTNLHFAFSSGYNPSFIGSNTVCNWTVSPFGTSLDLDVTSLRGEFLGGKAKLNWVNAFEASTVFQVERSTDGSFFETISDALVFPGSTEAAFEDERPQHRINYYRLRMQLESGETVFSEVVAVDASLKSPFELWQIEKDVMVRTDFQGSYIVRILDGKGMEIKRIQASGDVDISIQALAEGHYWVSLVSQEGVFTKRILLIND